MLEIQRAHAERTRNALIQWRLGRIPVHALRPITNIPLSAWPVLALAHPSGDGTISHHLPVFFRHGGRPAQPEPRVINRLYVDITALHVAFGLGILPAVEEAFGPLYLPPAARLSLVAQADDADRVQPNIVAAQQRWQAVWIPVRSRSGNHRLQL